MLSGKVIKNEISAGRLVFEGEVRGNSLLLSLGASLQRFSQGKQVVDPMDIESVMSGYLDPLFDWSEYRLGSFQSVLVSTAEFLSLPAHLDGEIGALSHIARLGMFAHFSSPFIGPRYSGRLCLEIVNFSGHDVLLSQDMPFAKVLLSPVTGEDPEHGHGSIPSFYNSGPSNKMDDLRSKYALEFGQKGDNDVSR